MDRLKFFLTPLLFLLTSTAQAEVVEIFDIVKTDLEGAFSLLGEFGNTEAVIDCASFINNMTIKQKDKSYLFYLSQNECVADLEYLIKTTESRICFCMKAS